VTNIGNRIMKNRNIGTVKEITATIQARGEETPKLGTGVFSTMS